MSRSPLLRRPRNLRLRRRLHRRRRLRRHRQRDRTAGRGRSAAGTPLGARRREAAATGVRRERHNAPTANAPSVRRMPTEVGLRRRRRAGSRAPVRRTPRRRSPSARAPARSPSGRDLDRTSGRTTGRGPGIRVRTGGVRRVVRARGSRIGDVRRAVRSRGSRVGGVRNRPIRNRVIRIGAARRIRSRGSRIGGFRRIRSRGIRSHGRIGGVRSRGSRIGGARGNPAWIGGVPNRGARTAVRAPGVRRRGNRERNGVTTAGPAPTIGSPVRTVRPGKPIVNGRRSGNARKASGPDSVLPQPRVLAAPSGNDTASTGNPRRARARSDRATRNGSAATTPIVRIEPTHRRGEPTGRSCGVALFPGGVRPLAPQAGRVAAGIAAAAPVACGA